MRVRRREHERARAVEQRLVGVGAGIEQCTRRVDGAGADGEGERAEVAARGADVAFGPGREQRPDRRRVVLVRGPHQRRLAFPLLAVVDARAAFDERVERRRVARAGGRHQRSLAFRQRRVCVGAARQQQPRHRRIAVLGRERQRRHAVAVARIDLGARVEQCFHELDVAAVHGPVQRRRAVGVGVVRVGALREQGACRSIVAVLQRARELAGRGCAGARDAERRGEATP